MPIASMTGYGYGQFETDEATYTCEIRSLNNRFLEVNVRIPRHLLSAEPGLQKVAKSKLARGKVDAFFDISVKQPDDQLPQVVPGAVDHYLKQFAMIRERVEAAGFPATEVRLTELLRLDGVTDASGQAKKRRDQIEAHEKGLQEAMGAAIADLQNARKKEGDALEEALLGLISGVETELEALKGELPTLKTTLRELQTKRLTATLEQVADLLGKANVSIPEDRLIAELSVMGDKIDIEEEVIRLGTHLNEFRTVLKQQEPVGRKLDFLCQEMHREINTMGNKMVHQDASKKTMNMKQLNEQIRQQVQNIE